MDLAIDQIQIVYCLVHPAASKLRERRTVIPRCPAPMAGHRIVDTTGGAKPDSSDHDPAPSPRFLSHLCRFRVFKSKRSTSKGTSTPTTKVAGGVASPLVRAASCSPAKSGLRGQGEYICARRHTSTPTYTNTLMRPCIHSLRHVHAPVGGRVQTCQSVVEELALGCGVQAFPDPQALHGRE